MSLWLAGSPQGLPDAAASDYPNKTFSIVLGVPPGGSTDMGARLLAQFMEKELKQPVVVLNKPGAAGTIGGYAVASAKPDGYTLGYFPGSASLPEVSSSPGEFHPQALTDPDVTVSRHPALIIQLPSPATLPYLSAPPITG
jgi:tripartite-type tricarboxylate transporter receptor subunit TctC